MHNLEFTTNTHRNDPELSTHGATSLSRAQFEALATWTNQSGASREPERLQPVHGLTREPSYPSHGEAERKPYQLPDATIDPMLERAAKEIEHEFDRTGILPPKMAEKLAHSANVEDRRDIASNPHCPKSVLAALSRDHDEKVQQHVAANRSTSVDTLRRMADSKSDLVQTALIRNWSTPDDALAKIAKHNQFAKAALNMRHQHIPEMIIDESI